MGESALRLHWYDAGLPRPELQCWVHDDNGRPIFRLDLALPESRLRRGVRRRGVHTSVSRTKHMISPGVSGAERERGWHFEVFTKADVYEMRPDPLPRLAGGLFGRRTPCAPRLPVADTESRSAGEGRQETPLSAG